MKTLLITACMAVCAFDAYGAKAVQIAPGAPEKPRAVSRIAPMDDHDRDSLRRSFNDMLDDLAACKTAHEPPSIKLEHARAKKRPCLEPENADHVEIMRAGVMCELLIEAAVMVPGCSERDVGRLFSIAAKMCMDIWKLYGKEDAKSPATLQEWDIFATHLSEKVQQSICD